MKSLLLILGLILGLATAAGAETKDWTILVYVCADNDIAGDAVENLGQMMDVGSGPQVNLAVQVARGPDMGDDPVGGIPKWEGSRRFLVHKGSLEDRGSVGRVNSASPKTLGDFVAWGLKSFPAKHYALIFWDHGGGASGFGEDDTNGGGDGLSLGQLAEGVGTGLRQSGVPSLDLIGFDACLMANYETAKTLAPYGKILLASEDLEPGNGWDYTCLKILGSRPGTGAEALASVILRGYAENCRANGEGDNYTLSVLRLDRLGALETQLRALASLPESRVKSIAGDLGRGRSKALEYGKTGDPDQDTHMVDLGALAAGWEKIPSLKPAADGILTALKDLVASQTLGRGETGSGGLSIYFPPAKRWYEDFYDQVKVPEWKGLLEKYYGLGARLSPSEQAAFATPDGRPADLDPILDDGNAVFSRPLAKDSAANVTEAVLSYGTLDHGKVTLLGDRDAEIDPKTKTVTGTWDLSSLTITQGMSRSQVYISEDQGTDEVLVFSVPFEYYPGGQGASKHQTVWLEVSWDLKKNEISSEKFFEDDDNLTAELVPTVGSKVVALVPVRNKDGDFDYVPQGPVLDPTGVFGYEFSEIDPRSPVYLSLDITDFGGHSDTSEFEGTLKPAP